MQTHERDVTFYEFISCTSRAYYMKTPTLSAANIVTTVTFYKILDAVLLRNSITSNF